MTKRTSMKGLLCVAVGAIAAVTGYTLAYLTDREEVWLCFPRFSWVLLLA